MWICGQLFWCIIQVLISLVRGLHIRYMKFVKKENLTVGDIVAIPIHGEFMQEEQICQKYEVVLAFKCLSKPEDQIIATTEEPMPMLIEAMDDMAYMVY